jgi:hypothetical protein|tara:strand:+ start:5791 stop:6228 length:438 start_codon:yes stop_codon:yes gene_type:complete
MEENIKEAPTECLCEQAGHCPVYQANISEPIRRQCQGDQQNRDFYWKLFCPQHTKEGIKESEEKRDLSMAKTQVTRAIAELKKEGIDLDAEGIEVSKGLGDTISKVLSKLGITTDVMKKVSGLQGCGCDKRKEWLNKIFGYKEDV